MSANQRGIAAITGCMASYSVNDGLVKEILQSYPAGQVIFVRGLMTIVLIGAAVMAFGHAQALRKAMTGQVASRSFCDGISTACFIAALAHMPMANLAAVLQIAPLLITALSVVFYRESVGWRRWIAIAVGFAGALLIVKPTPSAFDIWALVGVGAALSAALRELQNRRIGADVPTLVIAFWGVVGITLFGGLFSLFAPWRMFAAGDLIQLFVASIFVAVATYLMALGFRGVDLSVVAPFRYSYLITSAIAGYVMFRELPDGWSVAGAALIAASGLYALHREAVRRRQLTAKAIPAA